jgi:hypothetical protein
MMAWVFSTEYEMCPPHMLLMSLAIRVEHRKTKSPTYAESTPAPIVSTMPVF